MQLSNNNLIIPTQHNGKVFFKGTGHAANIPLTRKEFRLSEEHLFFPYKM